MPKDLNDIVKIEKAIKEKYGKEAIDNPKKFWTEEKERRYIEQSKKFYEKVERAESKSDVHQHDGVLVSRNLLNKPPSPACPVCGDYFLKIKDDLYMSRYKCCFGCFIQYVEDREERWTSGWRPQIDQSKCE